RIVIRVKTNKLHARDYRAAAVDVVTDLFPHWKQDKRLLFLAIEVWGERMFIALDINHQNYDFNTAHQSKAVLPVYVLRQQGRNRGWTLVRWAQEDESMCKRLAYLHNANGFDVATPFLEDHNSRIVHDQPR
ncbi:hypothetical protein BP00DRAFT_300098, partial [Aspergillus indologenus CBS 114.80]